MIRTMVMDYEEANCRKTIRRLTNMVMAANGYETLWFHIDESFIEHLRSRGYLFTLGMVKKLVWWESQLLRSDQGKTAKEDIYNFTEESIRNLQDLDPDPRGLHLSLEHRMACIREGLNELTSGTEQEPD